MNWADERYVRLFTRDSLTWKRWTWEARALLGLLLRKVDRAGVLEVGRGDKAEAVAIMLEVPTEVATRALAQWVACGTAVESPTAITLPSFIEAQECAQSDKRRQQESREKRRSANIGNHDTDCHTQSQAVTDGHTPSQIVTPAVPSRTVPSRTVTTLSSKLDVGECQPVLELEVREVAKPIDLDSKLTDDEFQVFEHWRQSRRPKAKATAERKRLIAKALQAYSVEELQRAIDGVAKSPHHMGNNDRHTVYDSIELILRDAKHIEDFMALAQGRVA